MPRFLVPKRSGPHRVAGIALYRALLQQCSIVPVSDEQRLALQNVTRNRFKENRELHSALQLKLAFRAGYEALDLLDTSTAGNTTSTARLTSLLSRTPAYLRRPPKTPRPTPKKSRKDPHSSVACLPPTAQALDARPRPRAELGGTGIRHVPRLVSANALPILRWKKPQPENLNRLIRDRIEQRQRRTTIRNELQDAWVPMAEREDDWDRIVREHGGRSGEKLGEEGEPGWTEAMKLSIWAVVKDVEEMKDRGKELARRMAEIVDRERVLAERERRERREGRRKERAARRGALKVEERMED